MNANGSEILYTEDNIPIATVCAENISAKATEKELKEYFERFGNVVSVSINRSDKQALVTFTEPQSATRALRDNMHCILGNPTKVRAGDSWSQPRKDPSQDEDQFSILNLNNDCLFHVASYLKLSDLLNMSKTCKRLEYVANVRFASYKSLDTQLFDDLTLLTAREILAKIGPNLQQITCRTLDERIQKRFVKLLPEYCSNVKLLEFSFASIWVGADVYKKITRTFKNLKTLKLPYSSTTDDVCAVLHNFADLENLDLSENMKITGRHLDKLGNLQTLNLSWCGNLEPTFFNALCMQTKLVSLNIVGCNRLDQSAIDTLVNTQDKLEDLSISDYYYANVIPLTRLKNLKRLTIHCFRDLRDDFVQELAKNRGAELQMLEIKNTKLTRNIKQALCELKNLQELSLFRCTEIDSSFLTRMAKSTPLEYFSAAVCCSVRNEGILNLIRFSDTIKKINVSLCEQIFPELVTSAVEILKTKHINEPLTLIVGRMNISQDIMDDPIVLNNRHLINLKFG